MLQYKNIAKFIEVLNRHSSLTYLRWKHLLEELVLSVRSQEIIDPTAKPSNIVI